jgi:hypothetical protein
MIKTGILNPQILSLLARVVIPTHGGFPLTAAFGVHPSGCPGGPEHAKAWTPNVLARFIIPMRDHCWKSKLPKINSGIAGDLWEDVFFRST